MSNGITINDLLRLIGIMAVAVAAAWAVQVLGFGGSSALGKLIWVVAAATIAGGGTGLIVTSLTARSNEQTVTA